MERDITKLNVVRRINFDDSHGIAAKDTKKKKGSERIQFLQKLKDEINNAKVQNQIERRRYVTRSSVKKNTDRTSQANSGANTPNHTQSDTCSKYELKEDPDREQYFNQKSTDDDHVSEITSFKIDVQEKLYDSSTTYEKQIAINSTNSASTNTNNQLEQCKLEFKEDPDQKQRFTQKSIDSNTASTTIDAGTSISSFNIDLQTELNDDPALNDQICAPILNDQECTDLNNLVTRIPKDTKLDTCTYELQKCTDERHSFAQSYDDDECVHVSPFNIDLQEELNNDPVLRDQELTDYIHQRFEEINIHRKQETQQIITSEHKEGYCSSVGDPFERNHVESVEETIHTYPIKTAIEKNVLNLQPNLNILETSSPNFEKNNDAQFMPSKSELLPVNNIPEQNVTMLRHASSLDYLGILNNSDLNSHVNKTTSTQDILSTTNEVEVTPNKDGYCSSGGGSFEHNHTHTETVEVIIHINDPIETAMKQNVSNLQPNLNILEVSSQKVEKNSDAQFMLPKSSLSLVDNAPEHKVTMLRHASSLDYIGILNNSGEKTTVNESTLTQDILFTTNEVKVLPNNTTICEEKPIKTMKKRDFFNKENIAIVQNFQNEKKVTVIASEIIPSLKKKQKKGKNKRQQKVLGALQIVNLKDTITKGKKKLTKRELSTTVDLNEIKVFEEITSISPKNPSNTSKQARDEIISKGESIGKMQYKGKKEKTVKKRPKITEVQTKPNQMLTRKRKREAQTELLESEDKEIKVVITPIKICDGEIRSDKKNTKEKEKQETFPEEPIDWDIQDDEVKNTEIDKPLLRKRDVQRSYVDFLSDNEDFEWSSTSWEGSIESESETDIKTKKKKKKNTKNQNHSVFDNMQNSDMDLLDLRTKRRRVNKRVARQLSKERGEEYITRNGKHVPGKYVKGNMYA
ncbi:hypothetical protein MSG28_005073 [Choristoneura fumiferana]|uniref:Uncharacterized protein n=1 Tax=Choristoneura fumiferana TaxID=7141 RepID=A0ACC0JPW2_CHOFU|nr:hypothetical protein MSG28_005073 [Choristoneura fumiferana]